MNAKLVEVLNRYIPAEGNGQAGGDQLCSMENNMENTELLVPIIGLQGVGKSTLLNAVLGENALPAEADETTCIPVEIRYGEKATKLFYQSGKEEDITDKDIAQYVDNQYNPGNEKCVSHIVLYRKLNLLDKGIVLVDLPGIGSMTASNQETTMHYLKRTYVAVCVVRVNPPITSTEASFIRIILPALNDVWFVQQCWNNETDREIEEGTETNITFLKDIMYKAHREDLPTLLNVNAYAGLVGVLKGDEEEIKRGNVRVLQQKLAELAPNWKKIVRENFCAKVKEEIMYSLNVIEDHKEKLLLSQEALQQRIEEEERAFEEKTDELHEKANELQDRLDDIDLELKREVDSITQVVEENIRANIFRVIDGGVTDGEDLSEVVREVQTQEFAVGQDELSYHIEEKIAEFSDELGDLQELIEQECEENMMARDFQRRQELKWEKGVDAGGKILSATGGTLLGLAIAGIPGLLAGLAVTIVGGFIFGRIKRSVQAERATRVKRELSPIINEVCDELNHNMKDTVDSICNLLRGQLDDYIKDRWYESETIKEKNLRILRESDNSKDAIEKLEIDKRILEEERKKYNV